MNVQQLITLAMRNAGVIGVGQTALTEDTNDIFTILNSMIAVWCRSRWLTYHLVDTAFTSTGSQYYTVGLGQQFNVTNPDKIHSAYVRQLPITNNNPVDYQLAVIPTYEDYALIALKNLVSFPNSVFFDSNYPIGKIFFLPIPSSSYELHLVTKETLNQFTTLTTSITFPPEYLDALLWNLTLRIRVMYQLPPDPVVAVLANNALAVIRNSNAQIPRLNLPAGFKNRGNVYLSHGLPNGPG